MATWLFLRGLTRESAHWGTFVDDFQQQIPGSIVLAIDLPGNGRLNHLASPISVGAMLEHCRAELIRQQQKPPLMLLAMSLGAMVAAEWVRRFPEEIAGCVLINTSFRPFNPFYQRLRPRNYVTLLRMLGLNNVSPAAWERAILHMTSNRPDQIEEIVRQWIGIRLQRPVRKLEAVRQLVAAARYRASTQKPAVSVLLLASANDQLVDVNCSRVIQARWGCPLQIHETAGHDLPLDDSLWVIWQVRNWLSRTGLNG